FRMEEGTRRRSPNRTDPRAGVLVEVEHAGTLCRLSHAIGKRTTSGNLSRPDSQRCAWTCDQSKRRASRPSDSPMAIVQSTGRPRPRLSKGPIMTSENLQRTARSATGRFLAAAAAALGFGLCAFSSPNFGQATQQVAPDDRSVRPFKVQIPQAALDDLRQRIKATRWPDEETVADQSQGVQLAKLQELVRYWGSGYDWRKAEAKLNGLPQFTTRIDGVDIHFIHVRSRHANALPVIIT